MVARRSRDARGMTMIEVMMSIVIATVGLLGALAMIGVLYRSASFTRDLSEAVSLAQSGLEAQVSLTPVSATVPAAGMVAETSLDGLGRNSAGGGVAPFLYTRNTTWGPSPDGKRREITVAVQFTDGLGVTHTVTAIRERTLP